MNNNTVVLTTLLNGEQAAKELDSLKVKAKTLAMTIDDAQKKGNYAFAKQMTRELKETNAEIRKLQRQTIDVNNVINNLSSAKPKELRSALQALNRQLDNSSIKRNSKEWDEINRKMQLVRTEMGRVRSESAVSESFFSRMTNSFNKNAAAVMSIIGAITGISFTFRKLSQDAAKMDDVYADVMKTTSMTKEQVADLNEELKKMDTRTSREALNDLARDAGKIGTKSKKDILDFVDAGNQIDVALGEDLGEGAIKNIGKMSEIFKKSTKELEQLDLKDRMLSIGSAINEVAQSSTASESYLVQFAQRLGGVASQAGISIQNILGYASALDQSGQAVEMSATAMQNFIMKLMSDPVKFANIAGIEIDKFNYLLKNDTNAAIKSVLQSLSEKGGFQQLIPVFQEMGLDGARAVGVLSALASNIKMVDEAQQISNKSFAEATSLTDEYNVKNENANAELEKRKKSFKDAAEELGRRLNPALLKSTNIVTYLVKIMPGILDFLVKYGPALAKVTALVLAYNIGIKAQTTWTKLALIEKGRLFLANQKEIAQQTLLALRFVFTSGSAKQLNASLKALWATTSLNPVGLLLTVVTALGYGLYKWTKNNDKLLTQSTALVDINKQAAESIGRERAELDLLLGIAKNEKISKEDRLDAIKKLNEISPEYLGNLDLENINTTAATTAIDKYTDAILKNAKQKATANKISELYAKRVENEAKIAEQQARYEAGGSEIKNIAFGEIERIEKKNAALDKQIDIYKNIHDSLSENKKTEIANHIILEGALQRELKVLEDLEEQHANAFSKTSSSWGDTTFADKENMRMLNMQLENQRKLVDEKKKEIELEKKRLENVKMQNDIDPLQPNNTTSVDSKSNPLKEREDALNASYQRQLLALKNKLLFEEITETEFQRKSYNLLISHYAEIIKTRNDYKADSTDVEMQLTDSMISEANRRYKLLQDIQKKQAEDIKKRTREEADDEDYSPQNYQDEKMILDLKLEHNLITEEEYQEALYKLREEYLERYLAKVYDVSNAIANISSDLSYAVASFQQAEEMSVDRKYDKMIKAAGNNSRKVAELEEEKEKAIHDVRAKYADKQFIITVAGVVASTATAAMESYKAMAGIPVVGPALGAAAAASAVLYGAGQIAVAKQQRDAAKEGYAQGGYTKKGNWWESDGMVHKNEFVGNRFAVANPTVRKVFDVVDQAQRNNTIGSLSESDFQTALNYREYSQQKAFTAAISGSSPKTENNSEDRIVIALNNVTRAYSKLNSALDKPIVAETYIEGKGGSKEANGLYDKMKKNANRK